MSQFEINSGNVLVLCGGRASTAVSDWLEQGKWKVFTVDTPGDVVRAMRGEVPIDIVLIVPDDEPKTYLRVCRDIKLDRRFEFVSVIYVVEDQQLTLRRDVYKCGANDCIPFPCSIEEFEQRLINALRTKRATDALEDSEAVLTSLATTIEGRDAYTHGHVERVSEYCVQLGQAMHLDAGAISALRLGGLVHDIGKVTIPDSILNKAGRLTDVEMEIVKRHPAVGYDILSSSRSFTHVLPIVRWHHERPNGKGYPDGIGGKELPISARIAAVADVFDALTTGRSYRSAMELEKCLRIMVDMGNADDLDTEIVESLQRIIAQGAVTPVVPSRDDLSVLT